jgi:hypothetical protein
MSTVKPWYNDHLWDPKIVVVFQKVVVGHTFLVVLAGFGYSGWTLLTGGRSSEVDFNTGSYDCTFWVIVFKKKDLSYSDSSNKLLPFIPLAKKTNV